MWRHPRHSSITKGRASGCKSLSRAPPIPARNLRGKAMAKVYTLKEAAAEIGISYRGVLARKARGQLRTLDRAGVLVVTARELERHRGRRRPGQVPGRPSWNSPRKVNGKPPKA